uniref:Uncharacterized protein isoform X1 n=1 Tax=Nicotiana tabacum TaxID=4097 RepID=A0A1S3ZZ80_TOBAC|nr:PREDICTED: uncharacterized protein LOC107792027 isoform X1 [Nicotiana tabacum]
MTNSALYVPLFSTVEVRKNSCPKFRLKSAAARFFTATPVYCLIQKISHNNNKDAADRRVDRNNFLKFEISELQERSFVEQKKLKRRAIIQKSFTGMVLSLNALSQLVKNYHSKRGRSTAFKRQIFGSSSWDSVETTSRY